MGIQKPWKLFWNVTVPSTNALSHLDSDASEKGDTRLYADNLWQKIEKLEFMFMLQFWTRVLGRFHRVSKALQKSELSLSTCAKLYSSLVDFLSKMIDSTALLLSIITNPCVGGFLKRIHLLQIQLLK